MLTNLQIASDRLRRFQRGRTCRSGRLNLQEIWDEATGYNRPDWLSCSCATCTHKTRT